MTEKIYDITIIGAGPAGLFTGFYGGMRQASVKLIESLPHTGGQLTALYPEKYIYDVPGFPKIRAQELVNNLEEQLKLFDSQVVLNRTITHVGTREDDVLESTSADADVHYTRVITITVGNGAFEPKKSNIPDNARFETTNLHYFLDDMSKYLDQHVVI